MEVQLKDLAGKTGNTEETMIATKPPSNEAGATMAISCHMLP
jgi:hypothetical protein